MSCTVLEQLLLSVLPIWETTYIILIICGALLYYLSASNLIDRMGGIPCKTHKDEKLLIFLGIIDILQSYR